MVPKYGLVNNIPVPELGHSLLELTESMDIYLYIYKDRYAMQKFFSLVTMHVKRLHARQDSHTALHVVGKGMMSKMQWILTWKTLGSGW